MGISMGGMQTFQWMVSYPDFMDKAIPIVGSPHVAPYDVVMWRINIDALKDSAGWNHGDYTENPAKLVHFEIGELMLQTPTEYNRTHTREQVLEALKKAETDKAEDANNTIRQSEAMMALDVSDVYGGSMEKAAAAVKAKVFVVVVETGSHGDASARPQFCGVAARAVAGTGIRLRPSRAGLRRDETSRGNRRISCGSNQLFSFA